MRRRTALGFGMLAVVLAASSLGVAQTTAKLSGVLTDETGGVLPGAQVTIKNMETGIQRSVVTDARGQYVAPSLAPGEYEITATLVGFETLAQKGIVLAVGQVAEINVRMKVGEVASRVEVTGDAPLVNTTTSSVTGVVEEKRIQDLPLNGRDFSQLALVQPGVIAVRTTSTGTNKGYGTRISMAGTRADQTAWLLDGTNIKSMSNFGTPASAAGVMLGVDAVQEFQVLTSSYSAEFGGTSGGVVNMVTKSGTNTFHGNAYEFLRNGHLDAPNFFDVAKPAFKRNQFGFSLGGPIQKDKAFFFGNYEGLRQRLGLTNVAVVPDENAHRGILPVGGAGLQQVQVAPEIRPYLDLWPLPNGPAVGGGQARSSYPGRNAIDQNYFVTRVDYHISGNHSLFTRFTLDQGTSTRPDALPVSNSDPFTRTRYATVQHLGILTPQLLATTRVAYNRGLLGSGVSLNIDYPENLSVFNKNFAPNIAIPGFTEFGPATRTIFGKIQNLYEFSQDFSYTSGPQAFKFGVDIQHVGTNIDAGPQDNGQFGWASLRDFLLDNPIDTFYIQAPGSTTQRTFTQEVLGLYFQDDWKWRPNFTLNAGLRYETFTTPEEKWGRVSVVKDLVTATAFDTNVPFWENPSKKNFSPRIGFSWDPQGDGKTAIRGGFGIFFVTMLGTYFQATSVGNQPFSVFIRSGVGNLASAVSDVARIGSTLLTAKMTPDSNYEVIQYDLNPSYDMKANLTIQRELPGNTSLSVGYLGGRGIHLWRQVDANSAVTTIVNGRPLVARGTPRLNPNTGGGAIHYSDAQSFYNALQVEVKKRFSHGLQFQSAYTWSKTIDDTTSGIAGTDYLDPNGSDPYNPKADRGLSGLHLAHNLVVNGIYAFPSPGRSGLVSHLFGGWQFSGIFSASSGGPFSALMSGRHAPNLSPSANRQRPDLVASRSFSSIILGGPDRYFDSSAFVVPPPGFYGNAGRNILIGPGFTTMDASLMKSTPLAIREGARLEFRADFFNLGNRANFARPGFLQVLNPATAQPIPSAGRITQTVGTSRQLQFSLKLIF